jgi:hypothetical protein
MSKEENKKRTNEQPKKEKKNLIKIKIKIFACVYNK